MKRILLIRFGSIGDVVLTTPTIRAVRNALPDAYIAMLVGDRSADIVSANPHLNEVIVFKREEKVFSETRRATAILREQKFDISIDMQRKFRSSLMAYLSGAELRIGYHRPGGFLCSYKIPVSRDKHTVDRNLDLLKPLGISKVSREPEMFFSDADRNYAEDIFQSNGLISESPIIGIFPGAGWLPKCWPSERFAAIADLAAENFDARTVLFAGPGEEHFVDSVAQKMESPAVKLKDRVTLCQLAAMIQKCDLFLGNDTGPMHISVAVGVPTIGLFGPGDHIGFHPLGEKSAMIRGKVPCQPCKRLSKCRDNICMQSIAIDEVWNAVNEILEVNNVSGCC